MSFKVLNQRQSKNKRWFLVFLPILLGLSQFVASPLAFGQEKLDYLSSEGDLPSNTTELSTQLEDYPFLDSSLGNYSSLEMADEAPPASRLQSLTEVTNTIQKIEVWKNKYTSTYQCGDFSRDFCSAALKLGVPCWPITFYCYDRPKTKHVVAVIQVQSDVSNRGKFCFVEPQSNEIVGCYYDTQGTWGIPADVDQSVTKYYSKNAGGFMRGCANTIYDWRERSPGITLVIKEYAAWPSTIPGDFQGSEWVVR